ncbi:Ubiquitin conjugation factor E4 family domain protein (U-box) [Legionella steigerwaltii]|uniref:Ubiquitin conjugation factor E4 family domain protein (U-box) n=1 Tax=Legionella steigerwaltii TaxID=460 RepID=A0A378L786_9GAMM|nr:U-box domain-containing protein [Legionella steigerwaltii]KTD69895.1 Ubiquitin conjugation factor E4 family domain protein (U-box) [Legionella steigerwaltii]STY21792.1 Ubiquitin conjugation factor E4 family domain protein (U-box) [Legionella steigerwaltii]
MQLKVEDMDDANVFIYGKMGPEETNLILFSKAEWLKVSSTKVTQLQENGSKLWLIRDSRVDGLLTVQSISWNKQLAQWQMNVPQRYMLSNSVGWIVNNAAPLSDEFFVVVDSAGGIIQMTDENTQPHLPGLLKILSENGYEVENRINPKVGQETTSIGYTSYRTDASLPEEDSLSSKLEPTTVNLPEGMLIALSCPLTTIKSGQIKVMKDPVTLVRDGISYERSNLLEKYPDLEEGKHFYPNFKLKTIINYVSATSLSPEEYWAKLQKVEEDIKDPILFNTMNEPVLSPSGHSFEKSSITKWISSKQVDLPSVSNTVPIPDPITSQDIRGKSLVDNVNLRQFIKAWPDFYMQQEYYLAITLSEKTQLVKST